MQSTMDGSSLALPRAAPVTGKPTPINALTTFPNPFADEPEPGLLPTFFSKVKSTFGGAATAQPTPSTTTPAIPEPSSGHGLGISGVLAGVERDTSRAGSREPTGEPGLTRAHGTQTEAQMLAAAVKERQATLKLGSGAGSIPIEGNASGYPKINTNVLPKISIRSPQKSDGPSLQVPTSARSSQSGSKAPSLATTAASQAPSRRPPPSERSWRPPALGVSAQTAAAPITSVTATLVSADGINSSQIPGLINAEAGPSQPRPRAHFAPIPAPHVSSPIRRNHRDSLPSNFRSRRSSFATIPDSPSSVSLSAMIHNAELSQNVSYVPGFPLGQDDTRSVRSLGLVKKSNSVSKIIRRMRGEGLSKHYWMLDEHCKECYDCKSVFTAWRRKHHCRICGQIFCSRCASNIIGARRFGQEGAVRVCNLCLKIMEEYRDDDDARSITSVSTTARPHSAADRAIETMSPDLPFSKSPFAASQLFSINPDDTLDAIEEGVAARWSGEYEDESSPPSDDEAVYDKRHPATAVPFRRAIEEENRVGGASKEASPQPEPERIPTAPPSPETASMPPPPLPSKVNQPKRRRVEFPRSETISTDGDRDQSRAPLVRVDSNQPLIGLRTRLSSRTSQSGLTSLIDAEKSEGLWRARSNSFAKRPELIAGASLHHLHLMLEQAIARAGLPHAEDWHRVLSGILLKLSTHVSPNIHAGDSIDVRAYVKIKKVPGGKITDSEYVDGIVISKNVAHKAMPRRLVNPRIMVVTFPLDYHRVENQFMSLDPIMAQEKDYLRLLTRRIIDVRPHIVLVERSASRLALDHLLAAGIAVARCVKPSAIHQVARCTQADIVASMDRLALEPRLGRCAEFSIQSFDHEMIPGRRKTLMRFEGCQREFGCTIILRGGDIATLRKVKQITDFMAFVAYQLKNEMILYSDEHNILPVRPPLQTEYQQLLANLAEKEVFSGLQASTMTVVPDTASIGSNHTDERAAEIAEAESHTKDIARSLEPYLTTIFSASASIRFPPPAPLVRMAELDRKLKELLRQREEDETQEILQEERKDSRPADEVAPPQTEIIEPISEKTVSAISNLSALVPPPTAVPSTSQRLKDPYRVLRKPDEIARDSSITQLQHAHAEYLKFWQLYTRRNPAPLSPENYQNLIFLFSLGWDGGEKPCVEPTVQHVDYYQANDVTLGQFMETLTADAVKRCPNKACDRLLLIHFRLLVHGDRRLQIAMDQFPCPSPGHEDRIITWSYCRICAVPSPTTIMRDETWKMSWGAYLEHCFYPPQTAAGFSCEHDAFRDQIRYFAHRNLAIRIHNESIDLFDPVRPSIILQTKAETKVTIKNQEYEAALQKTAAFFDSVLRRLRSFDQDICQPEKIGSLHTALEGLLSRAVADREEIVNLLNRSYKLSPMTDVLALNTVLRSLQDKVVQWDTDFADVEKNYLPSEKDLRRMTASHLKRLFAQQDGLVGSLDRSVAGLTVSEADEKERPEAEEVLAPCEPAGGERPVPSRAASEGSRLSREDDTMTPMATITERRNPLSPSSSQGGESDTTIGRGDAIRHTPLVTPGIDTSEMESDGYFVSRIPRRAKPAASIADLVKRFQETAAQFEITEEAELPPRPSSSGRRHRHKEQEQSDSDTALHVRPKLRRGRTDMPPPVRQREVSIRAGMTSDGDRSYAQNASRSPYATGARRPNLQHRSSGLSASPSQSGRNSPEPALLQVPSAKTLSRNSSKTRLSGKGSAPRETGKAPATPGLRPHPRRSVTATPSNRVTSIARHFDRLSRDAERERVKRHAVIRNKRARPVAATKAKVQVYKNVRDAFRDESDSDSSEADDEDNDSGSDDADSDDESRRASKNARKSPEKSVKPDLPPEPEATPPMSITSVPADSDLSIPISVSGQSLASSSVSEMPSGQSYTDRLKIDLPTFETSAPLPSVPATPQLSVDTADESPAAVPSHETQMSESELSSGGERSSILKTLTGLWAFRAGEITPLVYPLSANDHIFADSRVIIRENEPTSIIAFTLNSKMYRDKMKNAVYAQSVRSEAFMPEDGPTDRASTWDVVSLDEAMDVDDPYRREGGTHLKYDFDSGSSNIFCRIFFAEQFAALRSACQCEDSFVESLARCVQFDASGGKSGSAFLKTKDDRFICKEISRLEMDALTKFAPAYFDYTKKAFQGQRPTVLAKIYGFFKIGYRNAVTGRTLRMNVLVMENLFYERRFSKIYDLKGSTRNRLIQATGKVNEVLLDENLMEIAHKHPLYLREHSKRVLRTALFNDTLFLSNLNVMDYSLVVGVDQEKRELVVGIVDYIRTFTWDKKLESWVKDSAFLGGAKGEPTIVTPKQYKARFRAAMEKFYFPSVPDRWSRLGAEEPLVEEETALTMI